MKSLSESLFDSKTQTMESLFDKDLTSKKLSIEKCMDDFSSEALEKLDPRERNSVFDTIFESGAFCNAAELRKDPIDLTKNIIMIRKEGLKGLGEINYPRKYNFIYALLFDGNPRTFIATLQDTGGGKYYYWDNESLQIVDKMKTWKGKVSAFYAPGCSYSIISNEKWVNKIINSILAD